MKRHLLQISIIIGSLTLMVGCLNAPEYSVTPKIKFKRLEFIDVVGGSDSLNLTFDFEDGDGDIGLTSNDIFGLYAQFFEVLYFDSTRIPENNPTNRLGTFVNVTLSDTAVKPPFYLFHEDLGIIGDIYSEVDNRPPFNCQDYFINQFLGDTFFVVKNEFHSNLHIKYFKKENGNYRETTIAEELGQESCERVDISLRIPIFDSERLGKPTIGSITYSNITSGIVPFLATDTFRLEFFIYDRALNKSNTVVTRDFLLGEILKRN